MACFREGEEIREPLFYLSFDLVRIEQRITVIFLLTGRHSTYRVKRPILTVSRITGVEGEFSSLQSI